MANKTEVVDNLNKDIDKMRFLFKSSDILLASLSKERRDSDITIDEVTGYWHLYEEVANNIKNGVEKLNEIK